ncbi:MAG TPA: hypothetical protein VFY97_07880 [Rhodanobacteraceae bacterium]|jgi:hypothetical protein|nr:hypothetical protein [Rhodanobacteraceae bacterium]
MAAIATNRVVVEFYQGIDFPPDWAERPTQSIGVGLARNRVLSVAVLLDANDQPLAACWQAAGEDEQFVRIRFGDGVEDDLLDGLNDAMATKSQKFTGHPDLFATMLWEPESLRPDQGVEVHPPRHGSFFDPIADERGWNIATRELVARASDLLLVARQNATGLSLPVPANAKEMHRDIPDGSAHTVLVLPATSARAGG